MGAGGAVDFMRAWGEDVDADGIGDFERGIRSSTGDLLRALGEGAVRLLPCDLEIRSSNIEKLMRVQLHTSIPP